MPQTSKATLFIQLAYVVWGQIPNSDARTYWKIFADGSVLFESRKVGQDAVKTWRLDPAPGRFAEIERILTPAKAFIGKECETYPTVSIYWMVQWEPEGLELRLHAACLDAWSKDAYRVIYEANQKIGQWMNLSHPDFDRGVMKGME